MFACIHGVLFVCRLIQACQETPRPERHCVSKYHIIHLFSFCGYVLDYKIHADMEIDIFA